MQLIEGFISRNPDTQISQAVFHHYGSLGGSMASLFAAISGGEDWMHLSEPLEQLNKWYLLVFVFYVTFVLFGILNIVTAIFVEAASHVAEIDRDLVIQDDINREKKVIEKIKQIFISADTDGSGFLSKQELDVALESTDIVAYLKTLEWDVSEARGLFQLLDCEGKLEVGIDEFVYGMMRLKGCAKTLDIATMM